MLHLFIKGECGYTSSYVLFLLQYTLWKMRKPYIDLPRIHEIHCANVGQRKYGHDKENTLDLTSKGFRIFIDELTPTSFSLA